MSLLKRCGKAAALMLEARERAWMWSWRCEINKLHCGPASHHSAQNWHHSICSHSHTKPSSWPDALIIIVYIEMTIPKFHIWLLLRHRSPTFEKKKTGLWDDDTSYSAVEANRDSRQTLRVHSYHGKFPLLFSSRPAWTWCIINKRVKQVLTGHEYTVHHLREKWQVLPPITEALRHGNDTLIGRSVKNQPIVLCAVVYLRLVEEFIT